MIQYLGHNSIDKARWDDCISRSVNRRVYAFSWYLDFVCPGWDALVMDDYICVFPLTHRRKWHISYLAQPFFAQQLGVFSPEMIPQSTVAGFIGAIPRKFKLIEIHLNSMNSYEAGEGEVIRRVDYELDLGNDYKELSGNYAQNTRRNLKKAAESGIIVSQSTGVNDLIGLFRDNFGRKEGKLRDHDYFTIRKLMLYCLEHELGYILSSKTPEGKPSAAAFFLFDRSRVYFLFAGSAPVARENGAMFSLIDRFISGNASRPVILDFEGGNDPNLGRFYQGFGGTEVPYQALRLHRLPGIAVAGLNYIRKFRK